LRFQRSLPALLLVALSTAAILRCGGGAGRTAGGAHRPALRTQPAASNRRPGLRRTFQLTAGPGVERLLAGGDTDVYNVDLEAGQFLAAVVDQRGIDVSVDVVDPDSRRLFRADSPNGSFGPEVIDLVAERGGRYRLEVGALPGLPAGKYCARVAILRRAAASDRKVSLATAAYYQARALDKDLEHRKPNFWPAAAKYEEAARLFRDLPERRREAEALYYLGRLYHDFTFPSGAEASLERAAKIYAALHDPIFLANSLNELGRCYSDRGDTELARTTYDAALGFWRQLHDIEGEATTLHNLGVLQQLSGQRWDALGSFHSAIEGWRRLGGHPLAAAKTMAGLGWVYGSLANWPLAIAAHQEMFALARAAHDRRGMAVALTQLGSLYGISGWPQGGILHLEWALRLLHGSEHLLDQATVLNGLGVSFRGLGRFAEARSAYKEALRLYGLLAQPRAEAAAWGNLGQVANSTQMPDEAMEDFARDLLLAQQQHDTAEQARALSGMAAAQAQRGNLASAQERAEQAVAMIESLRQSAARRDLQITYMAANEGIYDLLIRVLMLRHRQQPGAGYDLLALARSEQSRARALFDLLRLAAPAGADPSLLEQRRLILADISRREIEQQNPVAIPDEAQTARHALADLSDRLHEVDLRIRRGNEHGPPHLPAEPAAIDRLRESLLGKSPFDTNTLLLEYHLDTPASYLWVVSADGVVSFELAGREILDPLILATYQGLATAAGNSESSAAAGSPEVSLSRSLLGPLTRLLGTKHLLIAADGALQYIPFAALPDPGGGGPLLLHHEVAVVPSLSVLAALRARAGTHRNGSRPIAILADPVFDATDPRLAAVVPPASTSIPRDVFLPRLVHSRAEADFAAGLAGRSRSLEALDFRATRKLATSGTLAEYRIVHFATHGLLRTDFPESSALVLSRFDAGGNAVDGYLRVPDIEALNLSTYLVVLSSCSTVGTETVGEGMVGLPQAFFTAGAQRVIATLWAVDDGSSSALMQEFYRHLLGNAEAPAEALRAAQLTIRSRPEWSAPRHWAGFVLSGTWP
jgi:CHAT domain-containing protein